MTSFEKIDYYRTEKGWSGAELTRKIGLKSRGVYTQWKKGYQKPSPENMKKMAELFGTTVSDLKGDEEKTAINIDDGNDRHNYLNNLFDQVSFEDQIETIEFLKKKLRVQSTQDVQR